jgi:hypothetical protein
MVLNGGNNANIKWALTPQPSHIGVKMLAKFIRRGFPVSYY